MQTPFAGVGGEKPRVPADGNATKTRAEKLIGVIALLQVERGRIGGRFLRFRSYSLHPCRSRAGPSSGSVDNPLQYHSLRTLALLFISAVFPRGRAAALSVLVHRYPSAGGPVWARTRYSRRLLDRLELHPAPLLADLALQTFAALHLVLALNSITLRNHSALSSWPPRARFAWDQALAEQGLAAVEGVGGGVPAAGAESAFRGARDRPRTAALDPGTPSGSRLSALPGCWALNSRGRFVGRGRLELLSAVRLRHRLPVHLGEPGLVVEALQLRGTAGHRQEDDPPRTPTLLARAKARTVADPSERSPTQARTKRSRGRGFSSRRADVAAPRARGGAAALELETRTLTLRGDFAQRVGDDVHPRLSRSKRSSSVRSATLRTSAGSPWNARPAGKYAAKGRP